jgi:aromatic ring-opening dioxygenase LigB subunit
MTFLADGNSFGSGGAGIDFVMLDNETARRNHLTLIWITAYCTLVFLQEAGLKDVKIIAVSIAFLPIMELYKFGAIVKAGSGKNRAEVAILASGDMSHRLKDDGPYEFDLMARCSMQSFRNCSVLPRSSLSWNCPNRCVNRPANVATVP